MWCCLGSQCFGQTEKFLETSEFHALLPQPQGENPLASLLGKTEGQIYLGAEEVILNPPLVGEGLEEPLINKACTSSTR